MEANKTIKVDEDVHERLAKRTTWGKSLGDTIRELLDITEGRDTRKSKKDMIGD